MLFCFVAETPTGSHQGVSKVPGHPMRQKQTGQPRIMRDRPVLYLGRIPLFQRSLHLIDDVGFYHVAHLEVVKVFDR